jgi:hypothetical protein
VMAVYALITLCTMQRLFICDFSLTYLANQWVTHSRVASATAEFRSREPQ